MKILRCKVCKGPVEAILPAFENASYRITPTFYFPCGHGESHSLEELAGLFLKGSPRRETSGEKEVVSN